MRTDHFPKCFKHSVFFHWVLAAPQVKRRLREILPCLVAMQTDSRRCNEFRIRLTCRECESCEWKGMARYGGQTLTVTTSADSAHGDRSRILVCREQRALFANWSWTYCDWVLACFMTRYVWRSTFWSPYSQKTKSSLISCFCSRAYGESIFQMSSLLSARILNASFESTLEIRDGIWWM